jgi:environmental stress-induced protein Ves
MMHHLTRDGYLQMPWANGRGTTVEILRHDDAKGMVWRLSMATVAENGPFSRFPGIERNLTVIDGPGFDLSGDAKLRADPFQPVTFSGDLALAARNVTGTAVDFNVMTRRSLPRPQVAWADHGTFAPKPKATLCIFALGSAQYGTTRLARHDFLWGAAIAQLKGAALIIQLFDAPP